MAPALEFEGISKKYQSFLSPQERWALHDFSLKVDPGEIVGFLGPNGAGKTTALHIALGLTLPSQGNGRLLGQKFGKAAARRRVGFLSENPAFYHQSARRVLKFCGALNSLRDPELSKRAKALLEAVELTSDGDRNIAKFSRGMLQRVGIAQALINDPELLLFDEPTSALDPLSRLQVRELLLDARAQGKAIFLSSHQLSEVELISDRVVFLQEGRVIAQGFTREFLQSADQFDIKASGLKSTPGGAEETKREGDCWTLRVRASLQRQVIEDIWRAGGNVLSVAPKTRSLEELFVELMQPDRAKREPRQ